MVPVLLEREMVQALLGHESVRLSGEELEVEIESIKKAWGFGCLVELRLVELVESFLTSWELPPRQQW